jgi:CheY-like chemotaxis protein
VDDNIFNIVTIQTVLSTIYNVLSDKAMNGQEAIDVILLREQEIGKSKCRYSHKRAGYRLILMDCNMPILDGFEATK